MDLPADLRRRFAYDAWANGEATRALQALSEPPQAAVRLLAHVAGVLRLWLARIHGVASPLAVWPDLDLAATERELETAATLWSREVSGLTAVDLEREVSYVNSLGEAWTSTVGDVLTQTLFHGVHHRGQILAELRRAGIEPPLLDFIHAARTGRLG